MRTSLVVTVIGNDRPGIVERVSEAVLAAGANWEESRMARLAGKFAGILRISVAAAHADALAAALRGMASDGLTVVVETSGEAPADAFRTVRLELVGNDHPGIIRDISRVLAQNQVNIEELETSVSGAPMSGEQLFRARAQLRLPPAVTTDWLRGRLEALAGELMVDVALDGRWDAGEHQPAVMPDAPHQRRRHLDERRREDVREHERPRPVDGVRAAPAQSQPRVEPVDPCVLRRRAQRLVVDVDRRRSRHAEHQRAERQHARTRSDVEHIIRHGSLHGVIERFQAERRRRVQPGAECRRVEQPECTRRCVEVRRNNLQASDANRARAQDPHRSRIACDGRGDRNPVDRQCGGDLLRRDAVRHQRRQPAIWRGLDVERAQLDQPIEGIVGRIAQVYAVGHGWFKV